MTDITIHIYESDEGGYKYDIYLGDPQEAADTEDSEDGGHCTTTMSNALGMAVAQAQGLIARYKGEECPGCNQKMGPYHTRSLSRYGHGDLCSDCGVQEAIEGDFINAG